MTFAYCYRTGLVEFGNTVPEGALPIDEGKGKKWREGIEVKCRRTYDGKQYLVPGVPEADSDEEAHDAYTRFCKWIAECKAKAA
jgi:hypothetical protein